MYFVYILFSITANKYYVGSCQNVQQRLSDHLNSRSKFTKIAKDWELKFTESFEPGVKPTNVKWKSRTRKVGFT